MRDVKAEDKIALALLLIFAFAMVVGGALSS